MYKIFSLFAVILIAFWSCSTKLEERITSTYPNGSPLKIEYYKQVDNIKLKVKEIRFNPNGEKEHEGYFENGEKSGIWTSWYISGEKQSEYSWKNGMKDGSFIEWYENGEIKFEGAFSENTPSGIWKFWNDQGELESEITY